MPLREVAAFAFRLFLRWQWSSPINCLLHNEKEQPGDSPLRGIRLGKKRKSSCHSWLLVCTARQLLGITSWLCCGSMSSCAVSSTVLVKQVVVVTQVNDVWHYCNPTDNNAPSHRRYLDEFIGKAGSRPVHTYVWVNWKRTSWCNKRPW